MVKLKKRGLRIGSVFPAAWKDVYTLVGSPVFAATLNVKMLPPGESPEAGPSVPAAEMDARVLVARAAMLRLEPAPK